MPASKHLAAGLLLAAFALLGTGCVTVGYDFLRQQATVTVNPVKGYKK